MTSENKLQGKGSANKGQIGANAYVLWVPRLITATAILHVAVGFVFWTPFGEIVAAGIVDSILGDPERESAFWYMFTGLAWLALGGLARWTARETGRIPARLGGWLIGIGATLVVFVPASGGWLVAAVGVIAQRGRPGGSAVMSSTCSRTRDTTPSGCRVREAWTSSPAMAGRRPWKARRS